MNEIFLTIKNYLSKSRSEVSFFCSSSSEIYVLTIVNILTTPMVLQRSVLEMMNFQFPFSSTIENWLTKKSYECKSSVQTNFQIRLMSVQSRDICHSSGDFSNFEFSSYSCFSKWNYSV